MRVIKAIDSNTMTKNKKWTDILKKLPDVINRVKIVNRNKTIIAIASNIRV